MAGEKKVKVPVGGKMVRGVEVGFKKTIKEDWNEYELEDGTILKMKNVVIRVVRTEKYDQNDDPIYFYNTSTIGSAIVPNKWKKKKQKG